MNERLVTFVIPTIGRMEIDTRTLPSLRAQTNPNWEALIVCDGWERTYEGSRDPREWWIGSPKLGSAGLVRNYALDFKHPVLSQADWIGFVDDDDSLAPLYVEELAKVPDDVDVAIFHMKMPDGLIIPTPDNPVIAWSNVGISFAVRQHWFGARGMRFIKEDLNNPGPWGNEDIALLQELGMRGATMQLIPYVGYHVRADQKEAQ